ncbi:hypothetical protein CKO28_01675 [Rhodovibrio sodomensis]|uniref:3-hydroxyisobutyryl-CoA hydrolase n=2 Tax=Rhodovibrio sodomensis TaxID=1088 RepID=A0ABS1D9E2_9PROT|nr:hypothetical protein [Rhodovibrio sodomensis]
MLTAGLAAWSAWSGLIAPLAATAPANHTPTGTAAPEAPPLQTPPRGRGVRHRQIGTVAHLTLDRPEKLNALDLDLVHALHDALDRCANDPAVDVVVIDGAGDTTFSAGGDVRAVRAAQLTGEAYGAHFFHELYALTPGSTLFPSPTSR